MIVHPSYGDGDSKTKDQQEKPLSFSSIRPVPETDTGGREENSKVLETSTLEAVRQLNTIHRDQESLRD